jgi:prevent-host-death family protein
MAKRYSIAQTRSNLPKLLHLVEHGEPIEITRRGKPIAVVLGLSDYRRLTTTRQGFWKAYLAFVNEVEPQDREIEPDFFRKLRDRSPGREVDI